MKDSKEYSQKIHKLYTTLKREGPKPAKTAYDEPLEAIVYAVISENLSEKATQSAMKKFADYFVDLNDLRVCRPEEVAEMLGEDTDVTKNIAAVLSRVLKAAFDRYNMVSLKALKKIGKRQARKTLEKIDGISQFVADYCMLTSFQCHAIPLTQKMIEYLGSKKLVHPEADEQEIKGFLTRQISAEIAYEFYYLLRLQSESRKTGTKEEAANRAK